MKLITTTLLLSGLFIIASCGWSGNQKKAARDTIGEGFDQGLEMNGAKVDPKVREAWLDCVIDKASEKWTFEEFQEHIGDLREIQEACAKDVNLDGAMSLK